MPKSSGKPVAKAAAPKEEAKAGQVQKVKAAAKAEPKDSTETAAIENAILQELDKAKVIVDSNAFAAKINVDGQQLYAVMNSLFLDGYIKFEGKDSRLIELTEEGEGYARDGTPEFKFVSAMAVGEKVDLATMQERVGAQTAKIGSGKAKKQGWIKIDGKSYERVAENPVDADQKNLVAFTENPDADAHDKKLVAEYKKRKHLNVKTIKTFKISQGPEFSVERVKLETELTTEMLRSGGWQNEKFKKYNFAAAGVPLAGGHLHPLLLVREQFKEIFLEMGFSEMPTARFVESSFWNFDALFQPQSHPARDAHDTFFIKHPANCQSWPAEYGERVKAVHSTGGYGSKGYEYPWKEAEAKKNLLRTHTTAISSQMLYKLAQQKEFKPVKYFSIDRVFRNETLDATHLAEFHQCEGLVADRNIGLSHLMYTIKTFFRKIGITNLKFKPAYNPYTEPSLELFGYHPQLKRWVELGNSGVFRPEMLRPMGLPEDVNVIAWGLSLERPTMIQYQVANIRDLFGHKVSLTSTKNNKTCFIVPPEEQ